MGRRRKNASTEFENVANILSAGFSTNKVEDLGNTWSKGTFGEYPNLFFIVLENERGVADGGQTYNSNFTKQESSSKYSELQIKVTNLFNSIILFNDMLENMLNVSIVVWLDDRVDTEIKTSFHGEYVRSLDPSIDEENLLVFVSLKNADDFDESIVYRIASDIYDYATAVTDDDFIESSTGLDEDEFINELAANVLG